MSTPRNTAPPARPDATPVVPRPAAVGHLRRRAVMVGNLGASSALFFFAACSDAGITGPGAAPAAAAAERAVPVAAAPPSDGVSRAVATPLFGLTTTTQGDTLVEQFTYRPGEGLIVVSGRGHKIVMPGGAICDPATSGYGPSVFNKTCAPTKASIRFTMRSWTTRDGHAQITFAPDVRFLPSKTVFLQVHRPASTGLTGGAGAILWCTAAMTDCVDEARGDKSVDTSFDPLAHTAWRRIKHFSGFNTGYNRGTARAGDEY